MSEYDITFKFEKTFRVHAKNQDTAKEEAIDKFTWYFLESQKDIDELMKIEIHHVESE